MKFALLSRVGLCALGLMTASALLADPTAYAAGDGGPAPDHLTLSIPVKASIAPSCGFATGAAPSGTYTYPDFGITGFNQAIPFTIACNTSSRVAIVSTNGGLLNSAVTPPTGYANIAPYDVQLTLNGDASSTATATCGAKDLATGVSACAPTYLALAGGNFTGPASATVGLSLPNAVSSAIGSTLRINAGVYAGSNVLVAGTYTDTLTITISPGT